MSKVLKSSWKDLELLRSENTNSVNLMYELIGIYKSFLDSYIEDSFEEYYLKLRGRTEYHYANQGIIYIHTLLTEDIHISKKKMRKYGRTHKGSRIVTHICVLELTNIMLDFINSNEILNDIYRRYIVSVWNSNLVKVIDFQYYSLNKNTVNKNATDPFKRMFAELKNIRWR